MKMATLLDNMVVAIPAPGGLGTRARICGFKEENRPFSEELLESEQIAPKKSLAESVNEVSEVVEESTTSFRCPHPGAELWVRDGIPNNKTSPKEERPKYFDRPEQKHGEISQASRDVVTSPEIRAKPQMQRCKAMKETYGHLIEIEALKNKCVYMQQKAKMSILCWDDDLRCGYTLYREFQRLLGSAAAAKHRERILALVRREKDNCTEKLQKMMRSLGEQRDLIRLQGHRISSLQFEAERLASAATTTASVDPTEEQQTLLLEVERTIKELLQGVLEMKMHRGIDEVKSKTIIAGLRRRFTVLLRRLEVLKQENQILLEKLQNLLVTHGSAMEEAATLRSDLAAVQSQLKEARQAHAEEAEAHTVTKKKLAEAINLETQLRGKLVEAQALVGIERAANAQMRDNNDQLQRDLALGKTEREGLEKTLDREVKVGANLFLQLDDLKRELIGNQRRADDTALELERELTMAQAQASGYQQDAQGLLEDKKALQQQLVESLSKQHELESQLRKAKFDHERAMSELQVTLDALEASYEAMKNEAEDAQTRLNDLSAEYHEAKSQLVSLQRRLLAAEHRRNLWRRQKEVQVRIKPQPTIPRVLRREFVFAISIEPVREVKVAPRRVLRRSEVFRCAEILATATPRAAPLPASRPAKETLILNLPIQQSTKIAETSTKTAQPKAESIQPSRPQPKRPTSPLPIASPLGPKSTLSPEHSLMLARAKMMSQDLLRRKPTADELAAVAISGSERATRPD